MPWKPSEPGEVPTLGWYVLDWMTEFLARPAVDEYEPFVPYREQEDFILRWYELNPKTGRFKYQRGLMGRPRGWGKSPLLAGLALVEALGDVLFDGWDADGQPVGRPWTTLRTPLVHVAAVSEKQVNNTWQPLVEMLAGPVVDEYPGIEPFDSKVILPRGSIEKITSSARTVKGAPTTFALLDQTEEWIPSNGGPILAQNIRTNTAKNGGRTLESPNAYIPGLQSVAERSAQYAEAIASGQTKSDGLLWDHREAPAETDLTDRDSLVAGLRFAYGDSSGHPKGCVLHDPPCTPGHVDLDAQIAIIWDPATDIQVARSDYLNQITHASDSLVSAPEWKACAAPQKVIPGGDTITLGFDGSRGRAKGKPDATALVACRVSDGHLFEVKVWEAEDSEWADWEPPLVEIEAAIRTTFDKYRVAAFYCDPAKDWRSYVNAWEAEFGGRVAIKVKRDHPFEWWMTSGRLSQVQQAVESIEGAIRNGDLTHSGEFDLTRHMLNARRKMASGKLTIGKANDYSPNKVDAAVAATLAWQARLDALAAGVGAGNNSDSTVVQRLY